MLPARERLTRYCKLALKSSQGNSSPSLTQAPSSDSRSELPKEGLAGRVTSSEFRSVRNASCTSLNRNLHESGLKTTKLLYDRPVFYFCSSWSQSLFPSSTSPNNNPPIFLALTSPAFKNWEQLASPGAFKWKDNYSRCFELTHKLKSQTGAEAGGNYPSWENPGNSQRELQDHNTVSC
ncbi:hypothetical protein VP01_1510g4 [Puccinia sorghi]|uniref:Uncharacterized protein n=1 Tax=Puccinia sorghi TaxID=27349 RepID=A0A0L6VKQ9_9BASI|nr:hypothetical protein VP01_1510g4 [Puccinia sorghi]